MAEMRRYGDVVVTLHEARLVVNEAPESTVMSLALLVGAAKDRLFVSFDRVYIGNDRKGEEIVYRVVAWDPDAAGLILERVRGSGSENTNG
jgi:hypothetical protein